MRNFGSYQIALPRVSMEEITLDFHEFHPPGRRASTKKTLFVADKIKYTWDEI